VPNGLFPEEQKKKEEEEKEEKAPRFTSRDIVEKALELYFEEHPEAWDHKLIPELEELQEGGYIKRAQHELMRGPSKLKEQLLKALEGYRQEVEKIFNLLKHLGEKPEWPPPTPEELIEREKSLLARISLLEAKIEKTTRENTVLEEKIKALERELEKAKPKGLVQPKKLPGFFVGRGEGVERPTPETPKTELIEEARKLWATYRNAVLANDTATAESALKKLKEIRLKLK